jgi:N-acetylglutamate synthase-like GNAT family acetyltransferase
MEIIDLNIFGNRDKRLQTFRLFSRNLPKYTQTLEALYYNSNGVNLAITENNVLAGGALGGYLNSEVAYLNFFLVLPDYRTKGFGTKLLQTFEARAKGDGRNKIECEILEERVLNWFLKQGYAEINKRRDYNNLLRLHNQVTFVKTL